MSINDIENLESFFNNLERDDEGHVVLNMFDNTILHDSFLASALRCSAPGYEIMPEKVRFTKEQNPWNGITYFTDKTLHLASQAQSAIKVGWLIEPGDLIPGLHNVARAMQDHFDLILTYEQNLLDHNPDKFKFLPCDTSGIEKQSHKIHEKTKLVSMIYSSKKWLTGHKLRHMIAEMLLPKIKYDEIDLLGRGTNRPLELKSEGTNDYMFQIAIENLKRKNYFADKIYDCFVTGTVPIYWGAPNIGDFFDIRGILVFSTPQELVSILKSLSKEKYESMLPYVKKNFELVKKHLSPDDLLFEETKRYLREKHESH
mgnify:FL=1|tara:strand:- start:3911 stop:4855 length:945 start_codon:yes stop_codon:yes gene_type:complete